MLPNRKLTDEQKIELVNLYKTGNFTYRALADKYGLNSSGVRAFLLRRGIKCLGRQVSKKSDPKNLVSQEEKEKMINLYSSGMPCRQIDKLLNKRLGKTLIILNNLGIDTSVTANRFPRKYKLKNENYFDLIDTEEKAYFLGLIFSDGFNNQKFGYIEISLQERDKDILEKLNKAIGSEKPLQFIDNSAKKSSWQDVYRLTINSRHISNTIANYGGIQRKSLVLDFPICLADHLIRHFCRGYFDGDGSLGIYRQNRKSRGASCSLICNECFAVKLNSILDKELGIKLCISHDKRTPDKPTRNMIGSRNVALKFLDWIYLDSKVYLDRKYNKYLDIKEEVRKNKE